MANLNFQFGSFRQSKQEVEGEGSDGVLELPDQRLWVVMDGIGNEDGNGQEDIGRLLKELKIRKDIRNLRVRCREALLACFGMEEGGSVVVALHLPTTDRGKAMLLSAGDCVVWEVRRDLANVIQHTIPDRLWDNLNNNPAFQRDVLNAVSVEALQELTREEIERHLDIIYGEDAEKARRARNAVYERKGWNDAEILTELREMLFCVIEESKNVIGFSLRTSQEEARRRIGKGRMLSVNSGSTWVLASDGVNLKPDQIAKIVGECKDPDEVAEELVKKSTKRDDRAVVVVRVGE